MPVILDDLLLGVPFLFAALRAAFSAAEEPNDSSDVASDTPSLDDDGTGPVAAPDVAVPVPAANTETILAVPGLERVAPAVRQALLDAATTLAIPVDSLALVISSESGWNAAALNPLPAAGFIQLTTGANLPGFTTADAIRSITQMDPVQQIQQVVIPFYQRFGAKAQHAPAELLYMLNFLPALAGDPESHVLGVKEGSTGPNGESPDDLLLPNIPSSKLTLGTIYKQNQGFDTSRQGYFTIGDVYGRVRTLEANAAGRRIDVAGNITQGDPSDKTAGGCGNWDFPAVCGNWAPWGDTYRAIGSSFRANASVTDIAPTRDSARTMGGPVPMGFEHAHEVFVEPDVVPQHTAGGRGGGSVHGFAHMHPQFGPRWYGPTSSGYVDVGPYDGLTFADDAYWLGAFAFPLGAVAVHTGDALGLLGIAADDAGVQSLIRGHLTRVASGPAGPKPIEGWGELRG